jgi:hypothetical protein
MQLASRAARITQHGWRPGLFSSTVTHRLDRALAAHGEAVREETAACVRAGAERTLRRRRLRFFGDHNIQHRPALRNCRRILRQTSGGAAVALSKVQSVDQRMHQCGVGFRQLRTCRRTRPGQLCVRSRHMHRSKQSLYSITWTTVFCEHSALLGLRGRGRFNASLLGKLR